ncbi:hypothetical protein XENOCAPTIV_013874 [Xenoophorus captivus]|uniref:Uncharacterized protein n=1 Tax=Xenoophorus captivus TaxID=1517983 RepID=A0ABV0RH97_9TELE
MMSADWARRAGSQVVLLDTWGELLGVWVQAAPHLQEEKEEKQSGTGGSPKGITGFPAPDWVNLRPLPGQRPQRACLGPEQGGRSAPAADPRSQAQGLWMV